MRLQFEFRQHNALASCIWHMAYANVIDPLYALAVGSKLESNLLVNDAGAIRVTFSYVRGLRWGNIGRKSGRGW